MDLNNHPCFNVEARNLCGRVHLPVAPECNVKCKFCNRKYDCVNESRPGVTSSILSPVQSVVYLERLLAIDPRIKVVGIAGPGDAFADPLRTLDVLERVRIGYPDMLLCVATNGLSLSPWVDDLARLGTTHVTVTVNAVEPSISENIYSWVRYEKRVLRGLEAGKLLLSCQEEAIKKLKEKNILVKINSIVLPGINDHHIVDIAQKVASWGADFFNAIPLFPAQGSELGHLSPPTAESVADIRHDAERFIPQMRHCGRCRADAAGLLGEKEIAGTASLLAECSRITATELRPAVAVASREGLFVNMHLGEARKLSIYLPSLKGSYELIAQRETPSSGLGIERWNQMGDILSDCCAVLVSGVGEKPKEILHASGIRTVEMNGLIEDGLDHIYKGVSAPPAPVSRGCGTSCSGGGVGCS